MKMPDRWKDLATDLAEFEAYVNEKGNRDYHAVNALERFYRRKKTEHERIAANDKLHGVESD